MVTPAAPKCARHGLMRYGSLLPWGFLGKLSTAVQKFPTSHQSYPWVYVAFYPHPLTRSECSKGLASLPIIRSHHRLCTRGLF